RWSRSRGSSRQLPIPGSTIRASFRSWELILNLDRWAAATLISRRIRSWSTLKRITPPRSANWFMSLTVSTGAASSLFRIAGRRRGRETGRREREQQQSETNGSPGGGLAEHDPAKSVARLITHVRLSGDPCDSLTDAAARLARGGQGGRCRIRHPRSRAGRI